MDHAECASTGDSDLTLLLDDQSTETYSGVSDLSSFILKTKGVSGKVVRKWYVLIDR
jgi:hypothetical protein